MSTQIDSLDHVTIITNNMKSTMHFYLNIIGLKTDKSRPPFKFNGAWLSVNNRAIIHIIEKTDHVDHQNSPNLDHIALSVNNIDLLKNKLLENKIEFYEQKTPDDKFHQVFIKDPNGIKIELSKPI